MEAVTRVTGTAAVIRRSNVDTDQIVPAVWLKKIERTGYQDALFEKWREDPNFVLNQPNRQGVSIIVAGPNFGCGSSREHAVWALRDFGIRAVISSKIADIHRTNLPIEGLVPVEVSENIVQHLMNIVHEDHSTLIEIDVVARTITCQNLSLQAIPFVLDDASYYGLINGYDPIDLTLSLNSAITDYESRRQPWLPSCDPQFASE